MQLSYTLGKASVTVELPDAATVRDLQLGIKNKSEGGPRLQSPIPPASQHVCSLLSFPPPPGRLAVERQSLKIVSRTGSKAEYRLANPSEGVQSAFGSFADANNEEGVLVVRVPSLPVECVIDLCVSVAWLAC